MSFPSASCGGWVTSRRNVPPSPAVASGIFSGNYFMVFEPGGKVKFQTREFEAVEESFQAHLMIDSDTLDDVVKNRKVLKGLRLPNH